MTTLLLVAAVVVATVALVLVWRSGRSVRKELDRISSHLADDRRSPSTGIESVFGYLEQAAEEAHTSATEAEADRDRFFEALRALDDGVVVVDAQGNTVLRNAAAERYDAARHADALAEAAIGELLDQARAGEGGQRELTLFGPPREVLSVRAVPLRDGSGVFGAVAFIRDVSEARRTESVRRDFVANVSHELKTPIGALALLAETMAAGDDPVVMHQLAERVLREADRLGRIVDDLLDLSLIEAQEAPTREPTPVATIVSEAVERVKAQADAADIPVLCAEVAPDLVVSCDHRQLVSALTNLLDNAVKYSEPGRPIETSAMATRRRHGSARGDHGARSRARHPVARSRTDLRALLPSRPGPEPGHRWHRTRPRDRPSRGSRPRWRGDRRVTGGRGLDVHPDAPARRRPWTGSSQTTRPRDAMQEAS